MRKRRFISGFLVVSMIASMLAGCGGDSQTTKDANQSQGSQAEAEGGSSDPVSMVAVITDRVEPQDTEAFKYFEEQGDIKFDVQAFERDVLKEKVNLMLSTNQYPEVFFKCSPVVLTRDVINKYGPMGTFIPLNDLIEEHMPNFKKILEERPIIKEYITSADGNIYSLPSISMESSANLPTWINKAWLDNLGLENPTSMEEFHEVLTAFKEQDANGNGDPNDEIPVMMSIAPTGLVTGWMSMLGQKSEKNFKVIEQDGKLLDYRANEAYKETLEWVTKFYQEGLIDQNIFTQTVAQAQAIGKAGDVTGVTGGTSPLTYCGPQIGLNFTALNPFHEDCSYLNPGVEVGAVVITDACKDPVKVAKWADQGYSEEGSLRMVMGEEGVSYKWTNEDKTEYEWIVPEGLDVQTVKARNALQGIGHIPANIPPVFDLGNPDPVSKIASEGRMMYMEYASEYFPVLQYSDADMKTVASIDADITAYADTYAAKVVTGEMDLESSWQEYLDKLESMGLSKMMEIKQAAYDAAVAK